MKIYAHGSYIGTTGFNNHTRDFFRQLSKYCDLKVRNFTVGSSWKEFNDRPHDGEPYFNDVDEKILYEQNLWINGNQRENFKIYPNPDKEFNHDFNIILSETNHHFFYDSYKGPKIGYTVWESTLLPNEFFNKLKEYDEIWTPSKWQKECMVKQGMSEDFIKVVPEGVDEKIFFPEKVDLLEEYKDGRFKFILFGRWDYRKSTKEIIETFLKTFDNSEPVDLIVSIDNPWGENLDGFKTTEERLENYGLKDERIKIVHFPSREHYIKFMKTGHVFVSCARAEGWNLPLIEAMACGTPSIYSNCSGQLEFAEGKGIPVSILKETPTNGNSYSRFSMGEIPGNYYEPDFDDLSSKMRLVYENYDTFKQKAIIESEDIRENFKWERIGEIGRDMSLNFMKKINSDEYKKNKKKNKIHISFLDGPRVDIQGDILENYFIEFLNENNDVIYSTTIQTGMWAASSKKYYIKWKIRINGEIVHQLDLRGKVVLISFESKSLGDTIAWAPYAIEFQKKHKCVVVLSTFFNSWFKNHQPYKDIVFVEPGSVLDCDALYRIGYFRGSTGKWDNFDSYPNQLNTIPLQQTASDILGLQYEEINYGLNFKPSNRPIKNKYIVFAPQSTAGCKEWIYDNWVELSKILIDKGYDVITLTSKPYNIPNVKNIYNAKWNEIFNYLYHSEFMVGLSSGLAWVNWALEKPTVMLAGFTEEFNEFRKNNIRISNNLCIKCWNDTEMIFDPGDWDWCPVYKGTKKQHICQRSITVKQVLEKLPL